MNLCLKISVAFCCTSTFVGCAWYGYGDSRKESRTHQLEEQAHRSEAEGKLTEAADALEKAAKLDPTDTAARWELARLHRSAGRTQAAMSTLQEVVALTPNDAAAWFELGEMQFETGKYVRASHSFNEALRSDPLMLPALQKQAELELLRGYDDQALELYHRILSIDENHVPAMLQVARIQMSKNQSARAALTLRSICYCQGTTPTQMSEARRLLGLAYGQQERWQDAAESLEMAIKMTPAPTDHDWYYLSYAQLRAGLDLKSMQSAGKVLQMSPDYEPARLLRQHLAGRRQPGNTNLRQVRFDPVSFPPAPPGWPEPAGTVELHLQPSATNRHTTSDRLSSE